MAYKLVATQPSYYLIIEKGRVVDTFIGEPPQPAEQACQYRDRAWPKAIVAVVLGTEDGQQVKAQTE